MTYTEDQIKAKNGITNFVLGAINSDDDYICTLSGFAGTGKSTIIQAIIQEIRFKKKVGISATTHTAKENISEIVGMDADTIQSLLGLRPNTDLEDFNPNKPVFDVRAEEKICNYEIIFIDECSMINKAAFKLIKEKAIEHRVKIVLIGDVYQLPPVGEKVSLSFKVKTVFHLTEIVRQSNSNPNAKLIELARNDVRDGTDTFIDYIREVKSDMNLEEGFKVYNEKNDYYKNLLTHYFDSEYNKNHKVMKTLAWTNKIVTATNQYVRKALIQSDEMIAVGDTLMGYKSITKEIASPPWYLPIVRNSYSYKVEKVDIIEQVILGNTYKGYRVVVKESNTPMFILHRDSYEDFIYEYRLRESNGKLFRQWKAFYDFKEQILVMENILDEFGSQVCSKDIDYGYAITVHKSQGGTFQNVAVTLTDIMKNWQPQERRQLIYVAVSRTSKYNCLYAQ